MSNRTLAAATLAAGLAVGGTAAANPAHYGGYQPIYEPAPHVVVVPETTPVYFKRSLVGAQVTVQQCYKRRAWTSTGELFWSEVCH
ncbi:hypothetical protein [Prosthecomicrobium sp. N25]|uniref:hypothetical protein n=1 Tax=Prosthecomicrobium sp. N25 TaxID=3129254 RepID=UPI003077A65C